MKSRRGGDRCRVGGALARRAPAAARDRAWPIRWPTSGRWCSSSTCPTMSPPAHAVLRLRGPAGRRRVRARRSRAGRCALRQARPGRCPRAATSTPRCRSTADASSSRSASADTAPHAWRDPKCIDRRYHLYEMNADGTGRRATDRRRRTTTSRRGTCPTARSCSSPRGAAGSTVAAAARAPSTRWPWPRPTARIPHPISFHETQRVGPGRARTTGASSTRAGTTSIATRSSTSSSGRSGPTAATCGSTTATTRFNPVGMWEARPVPGSNRVMATAAAHHAMTAGSIILLDVTQGVDGLEPITRLTPDALFPESGSRPGPRQSGRPADPLRRRAGHDVGPAGAVAGDAAAGVPEQERVAGPLLPHALSALGEVLPGRLQLRSADRRAGREPAQHVRPVPGRRLRQQGAALSRPEHFQPVADAASARAAAAGAGDAVALGREHCRAAGGDVLPARTSTTSWPPLPERRDQAAADRAGAAQDDAARQQSDGRRGQRLAGQAGVGHGAGRGATARPISAPRRGSPLPFQALDDRGQAVQMMRSLTYLQPGEQASCVGCHEPRTTAPPDAAAAPGARCAAALGDRARPRRLATRSATRSSSSRCSTGTASRATTPKKPEGKVVLTGEPQGRSAARTTPWRRACRTRPGAIRPRSTASRSPRPTSSAPAAAS